jgi:two-component SAPR family response regulator
LQFKAFAVTLLNTMNYQTVNFLNNFQLNSMQISSQGFNMLVVEKTQEDVSALLSRIQTLMRISSISYLNEMVLGLKGRIIFIFILYFFN